ncbi:MAG: archaellin/type IV pilin N-terminal domain-containing protein [Pyrodictiaceae archaeon]
MARMKGIVGIEAAIVLIAFVLVASALAFIAINMGMFATQKSKEVMGKAYEASTKALDIAGDAIAHVSSTSEGLVDRIYIPIKLTAGSSPIDLTRVSITIVTTLNGTSVGKAKTLSFNGISDITDYSSITNSGWYYAYKVKDNTLLEPGEVVVLVINNTEFTSGSNTYYWKAYDTIQVEIKPPEGAPVMVRYTVPPTLTSEFVDLVIG